MMSGTGNATPERVAIGKLSREAHLDLLRSMLAEYVGPDDAERIINEIKPPFVVLYRRKEKGPMPTALCPGCLAIVRDVEGMLAEPMQEYLESHGRLPECQHQADAASEAPREITPEDLRLASESCREAGIDLTPLLRAAHTIEAKDARIEELTIHRDAARDAYLDASRALTSARKERDAAVLSQTEAERKRDFFLECKETEIKELTGTCREAEAKALESRRRIEALEEAINWAMGCGTRAQPIFPAGPDARRYEWRGALAVLAGMAYDPAVSRYLPTRQFMVESIDLGELIRFPGLRTTDRTLDAAGDGNAIRPTPKGDT
jgi:hypothetical protein